MARRNKERDIGATILAGRMGEKEWRALGSLALTYQPIKKFRSLLFSAFFNHLQIMKLSLRCQGGLYEIICNAGARPMLCY